MKMKEPRWSANIRYAFGLLIMLITCILAGLFFKHGWDNTGWTALINYIFGSLWPIFGGILAKIFRDGDLSLKE